MVYEKNTIKDNQKVIEKQLIRHHCDVRKLYFSMPGYYEIGHHIISTNKKVQKKTKERNNSCSL